MKRRVRNQDDPLLISSSQALGCPVAPEESAAEPDFAIEKSAPARVRVLNQWGDDEFILHLKITNLSYAPLRLCGFHCRLPWDEVHIRWLSPSTAHDYNFRLPTGQIFLRREVLNRCHGDLPREIAPIDSATGVLLGLSDRALPHYYLHGQELPAELVIVDQYGRRHGSEIVVVVEKTAVFLAYDVTRKSGGLFERRLTETTHEHDPVTSDIQLQATDQQLTFVHHL